MIELTDEQEEYAIERIKEFDDFYSSGEILQQMYGMLTLPQIKQLAEAKNASVVDKQSLNNIKADAIEEALSCVSNTEDYNRLVYYKIILREKSKMTQEYTTIEETTDSTIPKKPIDTIFALSTGSNIKTGVVYLEPGERLSDLMNSDNTFLPIKDGESDSYLLVNKEFIITIKEKQYT